MRSQDVAVAAAVVALVVAGSIAISTSRARVSATTDNKSNLWSSALLEIDVHGSSGILFSGANVYPGVTTSGCAEIVYDGTAPDVDVHTFGIGGGTGLAPFIDLVLEVGTGSNRDCSDFVAERELYDGSLATFLANHDSYINGLTVLAGAEPDDRAMIRGAASIVDDNEAQGKQAGFELVFEVRP